MWLNVFTSMGFMLVQFGGLRRLGGFGVGSPLRCALKHRGGAVVLAESLPLDPSAWRLRWSRGPALAWRRCTGFSPFLLTPVFLAILISGAVLAFRPILDGKGDGETPAHPGAKLNASSLIALLRRVDPAGKAPYLFIAPDERTVGVIDPQSGEPAFYDLATGASAVEPAPPEPDVYDVARRIHKDLWFGLGGLVGFGTFAMLVLVILGPILSRPARNPTTALGRHIWMGWVLWPLLALLPVSVVLMKLHAPVVTQRNGAPMPLAQAIDIAARTVDLSRLRAVQALPGGRAMLFTARIGDAPSRFVIHPDGLHVFESPVSKLGRALHEGTWAGRWSGVVNLVSALLLMLMLGLGLQSWSRGMRRPRGMATRVTRGVEEAEPEAAHR